MTSVRRLVVGLALPVATVVCHRHAVSALVKRAVTRRNLGQASACAKASGDTPTGTREKSSPLPGRNAPAIREDMSMRRRTVRNKVRFRAYASREKGGAWKRCCAERRCKEQRSWNAFFSDGTEERRRSIFCRWNGNGNSLPLRGTGRRNPYLVGI